MNTHFKLKGNYAKNYKSFYKNHDGYLLHRTVNEAIDIFYHDLNIEKPCAITSKLYQIQIIFSYLIESGLYGDPMSYFDEKSREKAIQEGIIDL